MSASNHAAIHAAPLNQLSSQLLEEVFAKCFLHEYRSQLVGGASEPMYQPATSQDFHTLYYREDFFASALHEVAHWCLAGAARRAQQDYGYWYAPDGRDCLAQQEFEAVEYKPQALEWIFSEACGYPFRVSTDNLDGAMMSLDNDLAFRQRVLYQVQQWCAGGMPQRGLSFYRALCDVYGRPAELDSSLFCLEQMDRGQWAS